MAQLSYYSDKCYLSEDASGGVVSGQGGGDMGAGTEPIYLLDDNCDNIRTLARRNCRCLKIDDLNL